MSDSSTEQKEWVDWMNIKLLQKAVILDEEDNILLVRKNPRKLGERVGNWDLVGGRMETKDLTIKKHPHLEALKREILEETGLTVTSVSPLVVRSGIKTTKTAGEVLIYFVIFRAYVSGIKPSITLSNEHVEYQWLKKEQAMQQDSGNDGGEYKEILQEV
jgi:8-oxo-dGTP pyrophosphatase MutT (NUDIX family)